MDKKKNQYKNTENFKNEPLTKKEEPKKEEPKKKNSKRKVTWAGGVNVRKEPSLKAEVVKIYPFNFEYEVFETTTSVDGEWCKVSDGWTMTKYSEEVE